MCSCYFGIKQTAPDLVHKIITILLYAWSIRVRNSEKAHSGYYLFPMMSVASVGKKKLNGWGLEPSENSIICMTGTGIEKSGRLKLTSRVPTCYLTV